jgi:hypothetical protein
MKLALITALALSACSTEQKAKVSDVALDDPARRAEMMEAMLRVMDQHPEYVDEFFRYARRHPKTLDRFLDVTARNLTDPKLADRVAAKLTAHPRGLQSVFVHTLEAAKQPAPRAAIAEAVETRANLAAAILVDHPKQFATISKAIVQEAMADPNTKGKLEDLVKELVK